MLDTFNSFIEKNKLFEATDKLLLAVSGGMDSVVLVDLMARSKVNFGIAHANFGLRGEESDEDEAFVVKLGKKYKVPVYVEKFDTQNFAQTEKVSIQMAARTLRYAWFEQLMITFQYQYIATAHHQNDVLETVLLNLTRGTGISGLHGIFPKRNLIIRPLLFATKEEIRDYVATQFLAWREDSSNESNKYARNLIRNEVVPLLKKINPNIEQTIRQTVNKVGVVEAEFEQNFTVWLSKAIHKQENSYILDINVIKEKPDLFLYHYLVHFNFSYENTEGIYLNLNAQTGKQYSSISHILTVDREKLILNAKNLSIYGSAEINLGEKSIQFAQLSIQITQLSWQKTNNFCKIKPNQQLFDLSKLKFPMKVRKWKEGDWFIPLGMNGKKKISDFLIDIKMPLPQKETVFVLTSNESIVWVIGHRIDDRFKITDKTTEVLEVLVNRA